jgi:hypothetical protein
MNMPLIPLRLLEREPSDGYDHKRDYDTTGGGAVSGRPTRIPRRGQ